MRRDTQVQVEVAFLPRDEFAEKDWGAYSVPISPQYTEDDFQKEYYGSIEKLGKTLRAEGWKRGYDEKADFDILEDWYSPHRSLGLGLISSRIVSPRLLPVLDDFLRCQRHRWMINVTDERRTGHIDFKMVLEIGKITMFALNDKVVEAFGIKTE